ncbi:hypothetical protein AB9E28_00255 [Rhizobium leguminosarum]|uniref:hypothetical protein n=1 Tax=Rhizobium leguminosarum TaxID=384 RepID=UPI003F9C0360
MTMVRPYLRAVPNGTSADGRLRITLIATPERAETGDDAFPLDEWPSRMAKRIAEGISLPGERSGPETYTVQMVVAVKKDQVKDLVAGWSAAEPDLDPSKTTPVKAKAVRHEILGNDKAVDWSHVDQIWRETITPTNDADVWKELSKLIQSSLEDQTATFSPTDTCSAAALNEDDLGRLPPSTPELGKALSIQTIVPVRQADLAFHLEVERALKVASQLKGPLPAPLVIQQPKKATNDPYEVDETSLKKELARHKQVELGVVIRSTYQDRVAATKEYNRTKQQCEANACSEPSPNQQHQRNPLEVDSQTRSVAAKTQLYGSWPQKKAVLDKGKRAFEEIAQTFYTLQSDPGFSRLFNFVVDLEIVDTTLPASPYVFLSAESDDPKRGSPRVWTAAKMQAGHFWPVPKGEIDIPTGLRDAPESARAIANLDQYDGIILLGSGGSPDPSVHSPRYDVVSLDMRRAPEATGAESSITDVGKNPNPFATAGFIILDTQRALEAVRNAARADYIKNAKALPGEGRRRAVLFAEDLTIGRRFDVAIGTKGGDRWKSLMTRIVDYDFKLHAKPDARAAQSAKKMVDVLLGSQGSKERFAIDEASVVLASRLIPTASGHDAVVEEAIVQWDGTPMAVYCGPDRPIPPKTAKRKMPLRRKLGLPDNRKYLEYCLTPLRYGCGYRFAMRAIFPGNGSVPLDAGGAHLKRRITAGQSAESVSAFPPRIGNESALRRFLRQEGVGKADVLLPQHIAMRDNKEMGFEEAGRAVIRVNTSEPWTSVTPGRPYVPAADRESSKPGITMRIIVPPTVSQDEATRHGMLDVDRQIRLQGGLLDVRRNATRNSDGTGPKSTGYPIVVTDRLSAFDSIPAVAGRRILFDAGAEQGEAVFVPGANRPIAPPFFPDPGAQFYVLRLRDRGTGEYLKGYLEIPVYDRGIADWPNVRPLAVSIAHAGPRSGKASLENLLRLRKTPNGAIDSKGNTDQGGARVKLVDLALAPADDFDLEITCVPDAACLARWFALPEVMGALATPMGVPAVGKLVEIFGTDAGQKIADFLKTPIEKESCRCTVGAQPGPTDGLTLEIAKLLLHHIKNVGPIEELFAVSSARTACVTSRPSAAPYFPQIARDSDFKRQLEAIPWAATMDVDQTANLFGPVTVKRPSKAAITASSEPHIEAAELAGLVSRMDSEQSAKDFLLQGSVLLDLADADTIEIVATTVSPRASVFDDVNRRRGLKARRAGTWPTYFDNEGRRKPMTARQVYGFDAIDELDRVSLPSSEVALLRCEDIARAGSRLLWPQVDGKSLLPLGMLHHAARLNSVVVDKDVDDLKDGNSPRRMFRATQLHTFPDAKARRLEVRAISVSRSSLDWETVERFPVRPDTKQANLSRRQPLAREEQIRISEPISVWLPATERPAKCVVSSPTPVFHTDRWTLATCGRNGTSKDPCDSSTANRSDIVARSSSTRIYLDRGWFSSGEGERLGLVIWPPNYLRHANLDSALRELYGRGMPLVGAGAGAGAKLSTELQIREWDDELMGPLGGFATRWGGDPIRDEGAAYTEPFVSRKNFADAAEYINQYLDNKTDPSGDILGRWSAHDPRVVEATIPVSLPGKKTGSSQEDGKKTALIKACLITYEPCFDVDREQWYVDILIHSGNAANPFIRLGLVRYQEHAAPDLQVSEPIAVWCQVMPNRQATLTMQEADDGSLSVLAVVEGQASNGVKRLEHYGHSGTDIYEFMDRPRMRMELVHERQGADGALRRVLLSASDRFGNDPSVVNGLAKWDLRLNVTRRLLEELGPGQCYVHIEEIEYRMPASYASEPVSVDWMFNKESLAESGPRYSVRIPFSVGDDSGSIPSDTGWPT